MSGYGRSSYTSGYSSSSGRYNPTSSRYSNRYTSYSSISRPLTSTSHDYARYNRYSNVGGSTYSPHTSYSSSSSSAYRPYSSWRNRYTGTSDSYKPAETSSTRKPVLDKKDSKDVLRPKVERPVRDEGARVEPKGNYEVESVSLLIADNVKDHHTDKYEMCEEGYIDDITKKATSAQLIVRRGQSFKVKLWLSQAYKDGGDERIRVAAKFGQHPLVSKGTYMEMIVGEKQRAIHWSVKVTSSDGKEVELSIEVPATCAVGTWNFVFDTVKIDEEEGNHSLMEEGIENEVIILFNAWCKEDAVYMKEADWRDEYVLNDTGKIYRGSYNQMHGMPWNFGQFESVSLKAALILLDVLSDIASTARGNPIIISRSLSALVNCNDDNGILVGKWDKPYSDGALPTSWTGSVAILQKYVDTQQPVKYGQCWVYSGLLTTMCRTLGLPARSVTNFESAHDKDGSLTFDSHYDAKGEPMPEMNIDSIWNFHVWNECWMTRPDLKPEYGGWQAVDATPQETSDGIWRAGPASVVAMKNGDVGYSYDAPFIFSEVNADRVNWYHHKNGGLGISIENDVVGKCISTKAIGPSRNFRSNYYTPDREDITHQYKYPEGSELERAAVWRAAEAASTKPIVYFDSDTAKDVVCVIKKPEDGVLLGSDFELQISIINKSSSDRVVNLTMTLSSVYYTGVTKQKLKSETFECQVSQGSEEKCVMQVTADEYMDALADHNSTLRINYMGSVAETKQVFASQDSFRLRTIVPDIVPSKEEVSVGENFHVVASFMNPLKTTLTGCKFTFESAGNLKPTTADASDIPVGGAVEARCDITARRQGHCVIITAFECEQLSDLQSQATVNVN